MRSCLPHCVVGAHVQPCRPAGPCYPDAAALQIQLESILHLQSLYVGRGPWFWGARGGCTARPPLRAGPGASHLPCAARPRRAARRPQGHHRATQAAGTCSWLILILFCMFNIRSIDSNTVLLPGMRSTTSLACQGHGEKCA